MSNNRRITDLALLLYLAGGSKSVVQEKFTLADPGENFCEMLPIDK
jgi:hypothetical protein